jgi:hypothetical protein
MADDKNMQDYRDRSRVAAHEDYEIDYLVQKLGVSREEVEIAIEAVGNDRAKIEAFLQQHGGQQH